LDETPPPGNELIRERFQLKETIATIAAREKAHILAAKESIRRSRREIEGFIEGDPFFQITLDPYDRPVDNAPEIVQEMVRGGSLFGLGPMSAVAGAIARYAVDAITEAGAAYAFVENGGDISILNDCPAVVGIYAGNSPIGDIALEVPPRDEPLGICTSSGTVGPSISFGHADAAVVIARDSIIADSGATALGNAVSKDGDLQECFASIDRPGVSGAIVIRGREMALWGEIPPLRRARMRPELITRG